jgi:hypothetical protein
MANNRDAALEKIEEYFEQIANMVRIILWYDTVCINVIKMNNTKQLQEFITRAYSNLFFSLDLKSIYLKWLF